MADLTILLFKLFFNRNSAWIRNPAITEIRSCLITIFNQMKYIGYIEIVSLQIGISSYISDPSLRELGTCLLETHIFSILDRRL